MYHYISQRLRIIKRVTKILDASIELEAHLLVYVIKRLTNYSMLKINITNGEEHQFKYCWLIYLAFSIFVPPF